MKKILFLCLVGLCSCSQNQNMDEISDGEVKRVEVSITPLKYDVESRVLLDISDRLPKWQANDTIGIFPNKGGQVEFPVDEKSVGTTKAEFNGGGWALKSGYNYSAYYPYNFYNRNAKEIPFSYEGQVQTGSDTRDHMSNYTLLIASPTSVSNGGLTFAMNYVGFFFRVSLYLPAGKTYTSMELYADSEIIPVKRSYDLLASSLTEKDVKYSNHLKVGLKDIKTTNEGQEIRVWLAFPYMNAPGKTLKAVVKDSQGYVYVGDVTRSNVPFTFENLERNAIYVLKASPVLTDGFNGGIEDWVNDGQDYGGVAK